MNHELMEVVYTRLFSFRFLITLIIFVSIRKKTLGLNFAVVNLVKLETMFCRITLPVRFRITVGQQRNSCEIWKWKEVLKFLLKFMDHLEWHAGKEVPSVTACSHTSLLYLHLWDWWHRWLPGSQARQEMLAYGATEVAAAHRKWLPRYFSINTPLQCHFEGWMCLAPQISL